MLQTTDQESEYLAPVPDGDDDDSAPLVVSNPFGSNKPVATNAAAAASSSRAIAEIQASLIIAKNNPRNQIVAMDRILQAFMRPKLAEKAAYLYARGGTNITGPSIRAAEAIAQQWGNIDFGWRELDVRPTTPSRVGESTIETYAWDLETNTRSIKTFQIPHARHTKNGVTKLTDPRDIYEMLANNAARRQRSCMLAVIPSDVIDTAMAQAEATMRATVKITPELIASLVEKWAALGVSKEALEKRLQRRVDAIMPAQVINLGQIYNSVKDGMSAAAEWFEVAPADQAQLPSRPEGSKTSQVAARLAEKAGAGTAPATDASPATDSSPVTTVTPADEVQAVAQQEATPTGTQATAQTVPDFANMTDEQIAVALRDAAASKKIDANEMAKIVRRFGKMSKAAAPAIYRAIMFEGKSAE